MDIVWLGEPECYDARLVGGKAAKLSLLAASHRVPPDFCLTTEALDLATEESKVLSVRTQWLPCYHVVPDTKSAISYGF